MAKVPRSSARKNHYLNDFDLFDPEYVYTYTPALEGSRDLDTMYKYAIPDGFCVYDEEITQYMIQQLEFLGVAPVQQLSFEDTIDNVSSWKSSPGWPYRQRWMSKRDMQSDPEGLEQLRKGYSRPITDYFSIYSDFPKGDEFLKRDKRVRGILGIDFPSSLLISSYHAPFDEQLRKRGPFAYGTSLYDCDWSFVTQRKDKCDRAFSGDGSDHDCHVPAAAYEVVAAIREHFGDATAKVYYDPMNSYLVDSLGNVAVSSIRRTYSGQISTAEDNGLITWFLFLRVLKHLTPNWRLVVTKLALLIYGDDLWVGILRGEIFPYELSRIRIVYSLMGYVAKVSDFADPYLVDFLSVREKLIRGFRIPVLERSLKLKESMSFIRDTTMVSDKERLERLATLCDALFGSDHHAAALELFMRAKRQTLARLTAPLRAPLQTIVPQTEDQLLARFVGVSAYNLGTAGNSPPPE